MFFRIHSPVQPCAANHNDVIKWILRKIPPATGGLPSQGPVTRSCDIFFMCACDNDRIILVPVPRAWRRLMNSLISNHNETKHSMIRVQRWYFPGDCNWRRIKRLILWENVYAHLIRQRYHRYHWNRIIWVLTTSTVSEIRKNTYRFDVQVTFEFYGHFRCLHVL